MGALPRCGHQGQRSTLGLNPKTHAQQPVRRNAFRAGIKANAIVTHRYFHPSVTWGQADPDLVGLRVFGDVGRGFLHHAINHQFCARGERHGFQCAMDFYARLLGELVRHDLKGCHQPQVAQCRRAQVFDDAPTQGNAAVECAHQMDEHF